MGKVSSDQSEDPLGYPRDRDFTSQPTSFPPGKKPRLPTSGKLSPSRCVASPSRIAARSLVIASTSTSAELEWEEAWEPLHADIDMAKTCGIGPEMAFARAVLLRLEAPGVGVGVELVPCAIGFGALVLLGDESWGSSLRFGSRVFGGGGGFAWLGEMAAAVACTERAISDMLIGRLPPSASAPPRASLPLHPSFMRG